MPDSVEQHQITTLEQLKAIYGEPVGNSLVKELDHVSDHYRAFIEASPFVVVATAGPDGLDCTPRGDPPGFVRVEGRHTLMLPDRRGNNRVDSLRNLLTDPRISLLFLIPGVGETIRVNGRAVISTDPDLCRSFAMGDKLPRSVIVVTAERVYFQCPKALVRSRLWDPARHVARSALPSTGRILAAIRPGEIDAEAVDRAYPERLKQTIY
ncbi:MAG TPA: pyridoxamine 5'-phosphate oxidase family protein [Stellaceae bacterium]|nr:pyridoxamine 5'-phosphate oxidase family protein [Stellaceae bacterium]